MNNYLILTICSISLNFLLLITTTIIGSRLKYLEKRVDRLHRFAKRHSVRKTTGEERDEKSL